MIRATTGGVMKTYRSNLMNSFINMNNTRNTVLSQRNFNSYAEDPAAAAKAFRLRKSRMMVESQHDICNDAMKKYETAFSCLQSIDDVLCTKEGVYGEYMNTLKGTTLEMLNDPTGDARTQLNKVLDQMSQSIIQTMNQKYGDNFIFAGADGHNVPFEIKDGKLYYRGVWVDASVPNVWKQGGNPVAVDKFGQLVDPETADGDVYYLMLDDVKTVSQKTYDAYYSKTQVEMSDPPANETPTAYYIDDNGDYALLADPENYDGDVYYKLNQTETDEDGNEVPVYIHKEDYDEAMDWFNSTRLLNSDDGTGAQLVSVDKNGRPSKNGGYYRIIDESQLIKKEDYDAQKLEADKLEYLSRETYFVDIGYGFQEADGKLIESSAFNASLNGINFIGWGLDADGDPKNLYSLVQKMREITGNISDTGKWDSDTYDKFYKLVQKFEDGVSNYQTEFVDLDASTGKLTTQGELLSDNFYNLQEQYSDLEDVDMVDAITSFIWAEYCYNAALKVGNSILAESLMDYIS